jgi:hypothetical protein
MPHPIMPPVSLDAALAGGKDNGKLQINFEISLLKSLGGMKR